jgi:N-methylhydantoinase A
VELVSIQVVATGQIAGTSVPERVASSRSERAPPPPRRAYFGEQLGWIETPVLRRTDLAGPRRGPVIIEEYDTTCLAPPGATVALDAAANIVIELV